MPVIMPRILQLTIFACLFLLFVPLLCTCGRAQETENGGEEAQALNVIYILADDLGYGDLSCYGQQHFSTPNIDRLAAEGMRFTQHYSGSTVCAPSRSALLTGMHTGHTYIRGNKEVRPEGQHPLPDTTFTLAEMLGEQGYRTGIFGKWGLGYPGSEGEPNQQGFDDFYGYNCQRLAHHYYPRALWDNQERDSLPGNRGFGKESFAPDLIHRQALDFIDASKDEPFYMFYASPLPHAELAAADSLITHYAEQLGPEPPHVGYDAGEDYRQGPYESQERPRAAFAAMIHTLDLQVGQIMEKLVEHGLEDRTMIIFTSDNGPHTEGGADPDYFDSNGPLRGYKRDLYEGGVRVPMIAWAPGVVPAGTESDHISAFWDVFPTLAELTDAPADEDLDGISFLPTLTGQPENQVKHEYLYWEFHERGGRLAVRKGKWKGVRYNVKKDPNSTLELYNLDLDIGEDNNVADQHPEIVTQLDEILRSARTESEVFRFAANGYLQGN